MIKSRFHTPSLICGGALAAGLVLVSGMAPIREGITPEQQEILQHMSLVKMPDGQGNRLLTLRVSDLNLQLVNGTKDTTATNGLGNLIVGYGELGAALRTGSHNIMAGVGNGHSSYGGIVTGDGSEVTNAHASVISGQNCSAEGSYSCTIGGFGNLASGNYSAVAGGALARALGGTSALLGGRENTATGPYSVVSGGLQNVASFSNTSVSGGEGNEAAHMNSAVAGGCGLSTTQNCEALP